MTIGIYKLKFSGTDKFYIGQSVNIEKRFTGHIYNLKNSKSNAKLQNAYNMYGIPTLEILQTCGLVDLDNLEILYITKFDTINNGLNIIEGGDNGSIGADNSQSSYDENTYITIFNELIKIPYRTSVDISKELGVSVRVVTHLAAGRTHKWLEELFPEQYLKLKIDRPSTFNFKDITGDSFILVSPEGCEYNVDCIQSFAKEHNLHAGSISSLLSGKSLKIETGWHLKGTNLDKAKKPSTYYVGSKIKHDDGTLYTITKSIQASAAAIGMSAQSLRNLLTKATKRVKGWQLLELVENN